MVCIDICLRIWIIFYVGRHVCGMDNRVTYPIVTYIYSPTHSEQGLLSFLLNRHHNIAVQW